ncbi:MAG: hypothetical protein DRH30_13495 [Deltaproteobacteria bacterium]|nr:MAG: hypothetical protein DRH30_13495 [Deltaproteobacteria bacterium]
MDTIACGDCYRWAARSVTEDGGLLVHGTVAEPLSSPPRRYDHAWVERDGVVQDWQTMKARHGGKFSGIGYPAELFEELFSPERHTTYGPDDALKKMAQERHWGPWDAGVRLNGREQRVEIEMEPNRAKQMPWADHVQPFSDLPWKAIQQAIGFDRSLFELAKTDRHDAAWSCIAGKIHYRSGAPRLGEPIFVDQSHAKHGYEKMSCGRGTGHLGSGLYFFGTLTAAYGAHLSELSDASETQIREKMKHVWVVDVSSIPEGAVRLPDHEKMWKMHGFAKAMICYPDDLASYRKVKSAVKENAARSEALSLEMDEMLKGDDSDPVPDGYEGLEDDMHSLRDDLRDLRNKLRDAENRVRRDVSTIDFDAPAFQLPSRASYMDVEPLGAQAQTAVDAYSLDVEERNFPGYHPMTYYMGALGVQAVIQSDWGELNSGDVGCIWYPGAAS